jgi:hypothetical protein
MKGTKIMVLNFVGGVNALAKIHGLEVDYDFSKDGYSIRMRFANPVTKKYKDYIVHLNEYTNVEEAVGEIGDCIMESDIINFVI